MTEYVSGCIIFTFCDFTRRIRVPYPFQWGPPTFDAGEAFAMMFASFVALVEVSVCSVVTLAKTSPFFIYFFAGSSLPASRVRWSTAGFSFFFSQQPPLSIIEEVKL